MTVMQNDQQDAWKQHAFHQMHHSITSCSRCRVQVHQETWCAMVAGQWQPYPPYRQQDH
jgi:hypothetical protein